MTTRDPAAPNAPSTIMARTAALASSGDDATTTPLPAASPSALTTTGPGRASTNASAASTSAKAPKAAVGTPAPTMSRLA